MKRYQVELPQGWPWVLKTQMERTDTIGEFEAAYYVENLQGREIAKFLFLNDAENMLAQYAICQEAQDEIDDLATTLSDAEEEAASAMEEASELRSDVERLEAMVRKLGGDPDV